MPKTLFVIGLLTTILTACRTTHQTEPTPNKPSVDNKSVANQPDPLPDLGQAPELTNEVWLNTPSPLRLSALRGKVVLIDFWTFG